MNLKIQLVKTKEEYDDILEIRKQVFVREQNVPESIEIEYESVSSHVICFLNMLYVLLTLLWLQVEVELYHRSLH